MSPLARSLLSLACAALLHASSADVIQRVRAERPDWDIQIPCGSLKMGILDEKDKNRRKVRVGNYHVNPKNSTVDILFQLPNRPVRDEAMVGQDLLVCDLSRHAKKLTLKPAHMGRHSPVKAHCEGGCPDGIDVFADQYFTEQL